MADAFKRRQLLLRKEDGSSGGFIRLEQSGGKVTMEVQAKDVPDGARAVLLPRDGGEPLSVGGLIRGAGKFTPRLSGIDEAQQAAVTVGEKPLLIGGDGAAFDVIAKRLKPPAPAASPARKTAADRAAVERAGDPPFASRSTQVSTKSTPQVEVHEPQAMAAPDVDPYPPARDRPSAAPPTDGWVFTPAWFPGAPERITGHLLQNGETAAVLEAVQGPWAPEPPPGLPGFVFDGGYWVKVEEK